MSDPSYSGGRVVTRFVRPAPLLLAVALALALAGVMSLFPAEPVHAQESPQPTITVEAVTRPGETGAPVDATALFRLNRSGDLSGDLSVRLQTRNTRGLDGFGNDPTLIEQFVRMPPNVSHVDVRVRAERGKPNNIGAMEAQVLPSSGYRIGAHGTNMATVDVREPTESDYIVFITAGENGIAEGEDAEFTLNRRGDVSSELTAMVEVEDPNGAMQGNHWDEAPTAEDRRMRVTFAAGERTATVSFPTRPNIRDTGGLTLTASVQEDSDLTYWVGHPFQADVEIADDDTAPEFSLSVSPEEIQEGESLTYTVTRHGDASEALEDMFYLRIGQDARVRRLLNDIYDRPHDYPVSMAAQEDRWETTITVVYDVYQTWNSAAPSYRWQGTIGLVSPIPEGVASEYYTVRGETEASALVRNRDRQGVRFKSVSSGLEGRGADDEFTLNERFHEGQEVPFVLERNGPASLLQQELTVHVRYWELYHPYAERDSRGRIIYNPSDQRVTVTFPPGVTEAGGFVHVAVDDVDEPRPGGDGDWLKAAIYVPYLGSAARGRYREWTGPYEVVALIDDNPRAVSIVGPGDGHAIIEEGESASFTLTRLGPKDDALTVSVSIDDPGHFRRGNHWNNTPDGAVAVTFADGANTATLTMSTSDDWRDIPDNTLTATVLPSQDGSYRIAEANEGQASASVTVTDNDVAMVFELTAEPTRIVEGETALFTIRRAPPPGTWTSTCCMVHETTSANMSTDSAPANRRSW